MAQPSRARLYVLSAILAAGIVLAIYLTAVWEPPEPQGPFTFRPDPIGGGNPGVVLRLERGADTVLETGILKVRLAGGGGAAGGAAAGEFAVPLAVAGAAAPENVTLSGRKGPVSARAAFIVEKDPPALAARIEIAYSEKSEVGWERLLFLLPGRRVEGFTREGRYEPLESPMVYTRILQPYAVFRGRGRTTVRIEGDLDADYLSVEPGPDGIIVTAALDDEFAHPFPVFEKPGKDYLGKPEELFRRSSSVVAAGGARSYGLRLPLGGRPPMLRRSIHRAGAEAAIVFTGHADGVEPPLADAVFFGTSDEKSPDFGKKGIAGRGLRVSNAFYHAGQLERPDFQALADRLVKAGSEIGPHTISEWNDTGKVREGLRFFRDRYRSRFWIDHGASAGPGANGNNEALSVEGWNPASPSFILRDLREAGIDYAWNYIGCLNIRPVPVPFNLAAPDSERMTLGVDPRLTIPVILNPHTLLDDDPSDGWRLHLFPAYQGLQEQGDPSLLFDGERISQLERDRGILVLHDYFGSRQVRGYWQDGPGGTVVVNPEFDRAFAEIGRRVKEGRIWNPVVSEWGDFLTRDLPRVAVKRLGDRAFEVSLSGDRPVQGATFALRGAKPADVRAARADGKPVDLKTRTVGEEEEDLHLWLDLQPGEKVKVEWVGEGDQ